MQYFDDIIILFERYSSNLDRIWKLMIMAWELWGRDVDESPPRRACVVVRHLYSIVPLVDSLQLAL